MTVEFNSEIEYIIGMKKELKQEIGARIRKLREHLGLTQAEMVKHFDFGRANYSRIEKGEVFPNAAVLHTLNTQFKVSIDWLVTGVGRMLPQVGAGRDRHMDFAACEKELNELFDHIEKVPMIKHAVLGFFLEYKFKNNKLIGELLEELQKAEKQEETG